MYLLSIDWSVYLSSSRSSVSRLVVCLSPITKWPGGQGLCPFGPLYSQLRKQCPAHSRHSAHTCGICTRQDWPSSACWDAVKQDRGSPTPPLSPRSASASGDALAGRTCASRLRQEKVPGGAAGGAQEPRSHNLGWVGVTAVPTRWRLAHLCLPCHKSLLSYFSVELNDRPPSPFLCPCPSRPPKSLESPGAALPPLFPGEHGVDLGIPLGQHQAKRGSFPRPDPWTGVRELRQPESSRDISSVWLWPSALSHEIPHENIFKNTLNIVDFSFYLAMLPDNIFKFSERVI